MGTESKHYRGYGALRLGRCSQRGTNYFLTGCLRRPLTGLTDATLAPRVQSKLQELETRGLWQVRTSVLMPDHLHLLITLGAEHSLPEVVRLFKGPLTPVLRAHGLHWQEDFYDHHLRSKDELLPTFLYIFLNPYRANLIASDRKWPWYTCTPRDWEWFGGMTKDATPYPEWLGT